MRYFKKLHNVKILLIITILSFLFILSAYCGSLTPPGEPDSEEAAMHTVEDLYNLAKYRTHTPKRTKGYTKHPNYPESNRAGNPKYSKSHTLDEVYEAIQKKVGVAQPTGTYNISTAGWGVPWPNPRYTIMIYGCDDLEVDTKYASDPDNARMNCYNDSSCCFEKNDTVIDNLTGLEWVRTPVVVDMGCVPWKHCGFRVGFYRYVLIPKYNNGTLNDLYVSDIDKLSYYATMAPGRFFHFRPDDVSFLLPEDSVGLNYGENYNYKYYEYPVVYSFEADPLSTPEKIALINTTDWENSVLPSFANYVSNRTVEYTGPAGPDRDTSNENDTIDGYEDWRSPTIREAMSIIDFAYYDPALSNTEGTGQSYCMKQDIFTPPEGVESLFLSRGDPWINPSTLHKDYPVEEVYEGTYSQSTFTRYRYNFGDTGMGRLILLPKWIWPKTPVPWPDENELAFFEWVKTVGLTDGILEAIELDWLSFYRLMLVRNQGEDTGNSFIEDHPR